MTDAMRPKVGAIIPVVNSVSAKMWQWRSSGKYQHTECLADEIKFDREYSLMGIKIIEMPSEPVVVLYGEHRAQYYTASLTSFSELSVF